jgi:hypothetical protein
MTKVSKRRNEGIEIHSMIFHTIVLCRHQKAAGTGDEIFTATVIIALALTAMTLA